MNALMLVGMAVGAWFACFAAFMWLPKKIGEFLGMIAANAAGVLLVVAVCRAFGWS